MCSEVCPCDASAGASTREMWEKYVKVTDDQYPEGDADDLRAHETLNNLDYFNRKIKYNGQTRDYPRNGKLAYRYGSWTYGSSIASYSYWVTNGRYKSTRDTYTVPLVWVRDGVEKGDLTYLPYTTDCAC
jgi:hypothetical protein